MFIRRNKDFLVGVLGQKFAMLEMKTVISGILRKYILEPVDTPNTITLVQDFMLRSKNGIKIKLRKRNTQL